MISVEGIELIIDMRSGYKQVEYNMIPLFDQEEISTPINSYFANRPSLSVNQVKERLIRKYQVYKTAYYLEHKRVPVSIYDSLYNVDYQLEKQSGMHVADLSFTFLHWKIMEQLQNQSITIQDIDTA